MEVSVRHAVKSLHCPSAVHARITLRTHSHVVLSLYCNKVTNGLRGEVEVALFLGRKTFTKSYTELLSPHIPQKLIPGNSFFVKYIFVFIIKNENTLQL